MCGYTWLTLDPNNIGNTQQIFYWNKFIFERSSHKEKWWKILWSKLTLHFNIPFHCWIFDSLPLLHNIDLMQRELLGSKCIILTLHENEWLQFYTIQIYHTQDVISISFFSKLKTSKGISIQYMYIFKFRDKWISA